MGGLTDVSCHLQTPRHYGTFPWASRKGRTGTWPYQKPDQKIRVLFQEELISLQSSAHAEALRPDSCIQARGTRKTGRIGRAKERKERGKGERSIKSLVPYWSGHSGQLSASGGDQRQCRHTHKHREPKTNTRTDKRQLTTQCWVFGPPEFSCPLVLGSSY